MVLFLVAGVFFTILWTTGENPRGDASAGWMGWNDQSLYLRSAQALLQGDFSPGKHLYPPLYPLTGVPFVHFSPQYAFLPANLLALLWFAFVFIRFADLYLPRVAGVSVLFASVLLSPSIAENYVFPWTTNLSDALLAAGLLGLVWTEEVVRGERARMGWARIAFVSGCLGLIVATRPADAVTGLVVGLLFLAGLVRLARKDPWKLPRIPWVVAGLACGGLGLLVLTGFNHMVFANTTGGYVKNHAMGYLPDTLGVKFLSFWMDAAPLYGQQGIALAERYPWLLAAPAGMVWVLLRGDTPLRGAALAVAALFLTYLPFCYIMPDRLWIFRTIHYFKWTFPYLALFTVLLAVALVAAWRKGSGRWLPTMLLVAIPLLLLSLHITVERKEVASEVLDPRRIRCELPGEALTYLDFSGVFSTEPREGRVNPRISVDGRVLKRLSEFRIMTLDGGARVLFLRPVTGRVFEISLGDSRYSVTGEVDVQAGLSRVAFGPLKPFRPPSTSGIATRLRSGELVDFRAGGNGNRFTVAGWSAPEDWGCWSEDDRAKVKLRVMEAPAKPLLLRARLRAFLRDAHPVQRLRISVNGRLLEQRELKTSEGEDNFIVEIPLPVDVIPADGVLHIDFETPDARSPRSLWDGDDRRRLGIGLKTLELVPAVE